MFHVDDSVASELKHVFACINDSVQRTVNLCICYMQREDRLHVKDSVACSNEFRTIYLFNIYMIQKLTNRSLFHLENSN